MIDPAAFEAEAREFLEANAPRRTDDITVWGEGNDSLSLYEKRTKEQERARIAAAKRWKAIEFDAGFGWIMGPTEMGGRGLTPDHARVYRDAAADYELAELGIFTISLGMVAPTFLAHGQPIVRDSYVRNLWRGDLVGCQLFSEPGAGSDVAGLQTRAERDGDEWVINGQKVWTSEAHHADMGLLIARSNPDAPKHKGITAFALNMKAPGVEVRPLKMMTGGSEFNEVFLNDVRIPDSHRLGDVDNGWSVAIYTLMNERALGSAHNKRAGIGVAIERLRMMAAMPEFGAGDLLVRQKLAQIIIHAETLRYLGLAADARRKAGLPPGPLESVFKLANTENYRRVVDLAGQMLGPKALADTGEWGTWSWADLMLTVPGMRVAAGTDEIMRNILSERVLGLPKEPSAN